MDISIDSLRSEMVVAHNCFKINSNNIDFNDLRSVIKKHIHPNLFELLQIAVELTFQ